MNVALTLNADNKAMLAFDQPLNFVPGWVECAYGYGIRIVSGEGVELPAGVLCGTAGGRLDGIHDVLLVRFENGNPVEGYQVPFINQS